MKKSESWRGIILIIIVSLSFFCRCIGEDNSDKVGVTITSLPSYTSSSQEATFEFECNSGDSCAFECKLDDSDWTPCTSPITYTNLAAGTHVFQVRITNDPIVFDVSPENAVWEVALTGPDSAITASPANPGVSQTANFEFTCDVGDGCTFECNMDNGGWNACASPAVYTDLSGGNHQFQVRAVKDGAADQSPAQYTWDIAILGVYHFDEAGGAQVLNSAGDLNGSIYGAGRTEGKVGKALFFDSPSARVELMRQLGTGGKDYAGFGPFESGQMSIDAWINLSTLDPGATYHIIGDGCYGVVSFRFQITNGKLNLILNENLSWFSIIEGNQTLSTNVWQYVAVTFDGSEAITYIDGIEDNRRSVGFGISSSQNDVLMGSVDTVDFGWEHDFHGKMDEVRVFNTAVPAGDILNYYQETKD